MTLLARFLIPESPRYLLEVEKDSHTATQNSVKYFTNYADPFRKPDQVSVLLDPFRSTAQPVGVNGGEAALHQGKSIPMDELSQSPESNLEYQQAATITRDHVVAQLPEDPDLIEQYPDPSTHYLRPQGPSTGETTPNASNTIPNPGSDAAKNNPVVGVHLVMPSNSSTHHSVYAEQYDKEEQSKDLHVQKDDQLTMIDNNTSGIQDSFKTRKASVRIAGSFRPPPPLLLQIDIRLYPV